MMHMHKSAVLILFLVSQCLQRGVLSENVCNPPDATATTSSVPDCNCKFNSVDYAVENFISPILSNLTTKAFFRYFKVDLGSPCPFWPTVGQCVMEGCSVCTCQENEIPRPWLESDGKKLKQEYGWISASSSVFGFEGLGQDDSLGQIAVAEGESRDMRLDDMYGDAHGKGRNGGAAPAELDIAFDSDNDNSDEWTVFNEPPSKQTSYNLPAFASAYGYGSLFEPVETAEQVVNDASYVNLLENPERFTGYSGPSAQKVWKSIQEENCFGEIGDVCLEKRIFYRLMSGMQSSISTHIARNYLLSDGSWGTNIPLYWRAVGDHPDRLNNMYFAFLFLLRAVVRAQDTIKSYPYNTGNAGEDLAVVELLNKLFASSSMPSQLRGVSEQISPAESLKGLLRGDIEESAMRAVEECRYGFNESDMFQVSATLQGPQYWNTLQEKQELRDEFMAKFRNISRIMDCVTCDKCRVWGKLQILGIGTAIKILLHPVDSTAAASSSEASMETAISCAVPSGKRSGKISLNRQEIIALINTLNQFSNSLKFAAEAAREMHQATAPLSSEPPSVLSANATVARNVDGLSSKVGVEELPSSPSNSQRNGWYVFLGQLGGYVAPLLLLVSVCWRAGNKAQAARE